MNARPNNQNQPRAQAQAIQQANQNNMLLGKKAKANTGKQFFVPVMKETKTKKSKKASNNQNTVASKSGRSTYTSLISHKSLLDPHISAEAFLGTMFNPSAGYCRGVGCGVQMTALADFSVPFELTVPAGQYVVVTICPNLLTDVAGYGITTATTAAAGAIVANSPINSTNATTLTTQTTLISTFTTPNTTAYRALSCEIQDISDNTILNRGGWVQWTYIDNLYSGKPVYQAGGSGVYNGPTTYGDLDNYAFKKTIAGDRDAILHWMPSLSETYLADNEQIYPGVNTSPALSGFVGIFQAPVGTAETYRFQVRAVVEYIPSGVARALVEKKIPVTHPLAPFIANVLASELWEPLMIAERTQWEMFVGRNLVKSALGMARFDVANDLAYSRSRFLQ